MKNTWRQASYIQEWRTITAIIGSINEPRAINTILYSLSTNKSDNLLFNTLIMMLIEPNKPKNKLNIGVVAENQ